MNNEFFTMEAAMRPFACDRCGCIHRVNTNHEGQVYGQKCKNWPCTAGAGDYATMTYWGGALAAVEASHVDTRGSKVFLPFKNGVNRHGAALAVKDLLKRIEEGVNKARALSCYRGDRMPIAKHGVDEAFWALNRAFDAIAVLKERLKEEE